MPQLYILPAGLLFLYRCRRPGGKGRRVPAVLFAEAGAAWAACACLLLVSAWAVFPHGKSPAILPAVLDMYLLQPFFSLVMQLLSMAVFWLLRKAGDAPYDAPFSAVRFSAGVLMLLPAQLSYVFAPPPAI